MLDEMQKPLNSQTPSLEPMQLNSALGDPFLCQEVGYLESLITLELNDLAHLFIVDEGAVTGEFLAPTMSLRNNRAENTVTFLNAFRSFLASYSTTDSNQYREPMTHVNTVATFGQSLQRSQSLPSIPLLNSNMYVILLRTNVFTVIKRVSLVCKRVCRMRCQCGKPLKSGDAPKGLRFCTLMR
jgi:hypothetical protein